MYESVSLWDKGKQQSRNTQVCVGKLDPVSGAFIPSKRRLAGTGTTAAAQAARVPSTATATIVGPSLILNHFAESLALPKLLKAAFPESHRDILSIAYYLATRSGPLCHCEAWMNTHDLPSAAALPGQRISELLATIGTDEQQTFLASWMKRIVEDDLLCYDITSISSYSERNDYIRYGHNRDRERLPQLNLAMLFGQHSGLPAYYHRTPGNITDVQTVHNLLATFRKLEVGSLHYVLDKGFYSRKNVDELLEDKDHFTLSVPLNNLWVQQAIDDIHESIEGPDHLRMIDQDVFYVQSRLYPWDGSSRRCYLHLYYNAYIRAQAVERFSKELLSYKEELEAGRTVLEHQEMYDAWFIITTTPVRGRKVQYNEEAVRRYIKRYAGFQALLTTHIKDPVRALQVYRDKDVVEKCFDDLKNSLDMKRLRMHSIKTVDGRLFVQFIALILMSALRKRMRDSRLIEKYSVKELLLEMEPLTRIRYEGKYGTVLTEVTKPQREILTLLGIDIPKSA